MCKDLKHANQEEQEVVSMRPDVGANRWPSTASKATHPLHLGAPFLPTHKGLLPWALHLPCWSNRLISLSTPSSGKAQGITVQDLSPAGCCPLSGRTGEAMASTSLGPRATSPFLFVSPVTAAPLSSGNAHAS